MDELYKILKDDKTILSKKKGILAGWTPGKIFGRLDCKSGMRMKKENRVFFHSLEGAVTQNYRPCKKCKPINKEDFERIKYLVPYKTVEEFYDRDDKK